MLAKLTLSRDFTKQNRAEEDAGLRDDAMVKKILDSFN